MNTEATSLYGSPAQTLTPIYIPAEKFADLQKEGKVFEHISLSSRPSESRPLQNGESIATAHHNPPAYQTTFEAITTVDHTPPTYQTRTELRSLTVNTAKKSTIFERFATDIDARLSKPDLKLKAQNATSEFVAALAPGSGADIDSAVGKFLIAMHEISARLEKIKSSSLLAGIESDIGNAISQVLVERLGETGSQVDAACIQNIKQVLTLLNSSGPGTSYSFEQQACESIAHQTLKIFQEQLFTNLKSQAREAVIALLRTLKLGPKKLENASIIFNKTIKIISEQEVHLHGNELYENFGPEIEKEIKGAALQIFRNDVNKNNKADWIMIKTKLCQANKNTNDENCLNGILCASNRLKIQLEWMDECDFLENIERGIKAFIEFRLESYYGSSEAETLVHTTDKIIGKIKNNIKLNCGKKEERKIAAKILANRTHFSELLMAGDKTVYSIPKNFQLTFFKNDVENYLKNNVTDLDLAISAIFIDHFEKVITEKLLNIQRN